jgi:hypothetical protein
LDCSKRKKREDFQNRKRSKDICGAKSGRSVEEYVELAIDFIDDKDAPKDKTARYFRAMRY